MNADELLDHWADRVKQGESVELPWNTLRQTFFKEGMPHEAWQRMVEQFARRGVAAREERRKGRHEQSVVWVVLVRLDGTLVGSNEPLQKPSALILPADAKASDA